MPAPEVGTTADPPEFDPERSPLTLPPHLEVTRALQLVTGRWVIPVLARLADGPKRHGELRAGIPGISEKVLTETLRRMERDGLVRRELAEGRSTYIVYRSTPLASSLSTALRSVARWEGRHWDQVERARQRQLAS